MRRLARAGALATVVTLGVAACQAAESDPDPGTPTSATSSDPGRLLTDEEAMLALPMMVEIPVPASIDPEPVAVDPAQSSYPAVCKDITMSGPAAQEVVKKRESDAERGYVLGKHGYVKVRLSSFTDPVPATPFEAAGDAVSQCGSFQLIDKRGASSWDLETLAFPSLGDRTYAIRSRNTTKGDDGEGGEVDFVVIARGHNLVRIVYSATPPNKPVPDLPEKLARVVLKNLEGG